MSPPWLLGQGEGVPKDRAASVDQVQVMTGRGTVPSQAFRARDAEGRNMADTRQSTGRDGRGKTDPTQGIGISLAGAVDLTAVKHHVEAKPGQAGGAPKAGGYVVDATASSFQAIVQSSRTYPVLLYVWVDDDDRIFDFTRQLQDAVNKLGGKVQLARLDMHKYPEVPQSLGLQGAPALLLLLAGRAIPITQGLPQGGEMQQILEVINHIPQLAAKAGVTGTAPKMEGGEGESGSDSRKETVPPEHRKAHDLAEQGDYAGAALEYKKVLDANPNDRIAARERAKALLLARSGQVDTRAAQADAAAKPDDVDAQLQMADVDMIGGHVEDAFGRLLDFARTHRAQIDAVRARIVSYFPMFEPDDKRVMRVRMRLATLMY